MSRIQVTYVDHMGSDLSVVNAARVSFGKSKQQLDEKDIKLINYLSEHQHFTPFEHCVVSIKIKCPLYIRSQIMRHRTASFNEISRRYTSENIEFYEPYEFRKQHNKSKQCSDGPIDPSLETHAHFHFKTSIQESLRHYEELLKLGVSREMARGVLPQAMMTEFIMTANLRNFVHFVKLRTDIHAQEEAREIGEAVKQILLTKFPESTKALLCKN